MNNDISEMKEALCKIVAHQEYQSKVTQRSFVLLILVIIIGGGISIYWSTYWDA
jgi:GMP synthase-like glutamine amidotransferase